MICLEVLQLIVDTLQVLKNLKSALKEDGEIILSLPNEFHIRQSVKILFGRFGQETEFIIGGTFLPVMDF
jgi:2-polyprenyl-3-methyl-5-hydroxy-6-metoxy-1,4-benzoquinol methylase